MAKKKAPALVVEDHGNGYMIIGTGSILSAKAELADYVDDVDPYRFACPTIYDERLAVWLATDPISCWDGATDGAGNAVR